jgi:hypothetical protein
MSEQMIPWAAWATLVILAVLCLPIGACQKFVLSVSTWLLRLALLAVLAGGAYLYFRPGEMPAQVSNVLNDFPGVLNLLPDRAAAHFGLCLACLIAVPLLPLLMVLDVTRSLAGRRLGRLRALADGRADAMATGPVRRTVVETVPVPVPTPVMEATPIMRPIDRRTASATIATAPRSHLPVAPTAR